MKKACFPCPMDSKPLFILLNDNEWKYMDSKKSLPLGGKVLYRRIYYVFVHKPIHLLFIYKTIIMKKSNYYS